MSTINYNSEKDFEIAEILENDIFPFIRFGTYSGIVVNRRNCITYTNILGADYPNGGEKTSNSPQEINHR